MSLDENEILTIFRIRKTTLQMLRDRGYVVFDSKDDLDFFEDIINHHYDDEPDHKKRLSMIVDEIERINNNKELFVNFYKNNQDSFEKNKQKIIGLLDFINKDYDFFKNLI